MPRIAGIYNRQKCATAAHQANRMLQAVKPLVSCNQATVSTNDLTSFGWQGRGVPKIISKNGLHIILDGMIYNLTELGPAANEQTLLANLYQQYGFEKTLTMLNGDFAIAIYDERMDTLWLARDRFGLKPLYYVATKDKLSFASRMSSLLTLPEVKPDVNRQFVALFAASHYRYFDNSPEQSPFKNITQLPAAHYLKYSNGISTVHRYWNLCQQPDFSESEEILAERYQSLLLDAVKLRLNYAQRPAFTLSGGMDSSSIMASAVRVLNKKQHAFSSIYTDKTYDESDEIKSMLETQVEQWHTVSIDIPDVFSLVQKMIAVHDEPVATATWLSHYLLCQQASQEGFCSFWGGLGGDELNAGEYEHFIYFFADLRRLGLEDRLTEEVKMWAQYHDHPIFRKSPRYMEDQLKKLINFAKPGYCLVDQARWQRYLNVLNPEYFDLNSFIPTMEHPFDSYLKNRTYQDLTRETIPCCLRAEDRQTDAFGLNNFLPFFDYRLVEFMFRVPSTLKYRNGVTKSLLRQATKGLLPEETRTRVKKTGWNAPAHQWFSGKGRTQILDILHSTGFRNRGIYDLNKVTHLIDEHNKIVSEGQPKDNHMMFLWQLVNLELWLNSLSI